MELRCDLVFFDARCQYLRREHFRVVFGAKAKEFDVAIIPAAAQVVRDPVHSDEVIVWMIDAAASELHQVAVADPGEELARLDRPIRRSERADAKAGNASTIFVGIKPTYRLR